MATGTDVVEAATARLKLESPGTLRPPSIIVPGAGLAGGGRRNLDLGMMDLPLESGQAALMLDSPAPNPNLDDERSESSKLSDADPLAALPPQALKEEDDEGMDLDDVDDAGPSCTQGKGLGVVKRAWTVDEDEQLMQLVQEHGPRRWSVIASQLPGRVGKQCRERCVPPRPRPPPPDACAATRPKLARSVAWR